MKTKFLCDCEFNKLKNYVVREGTVCEAEYTDDGFVAIRLPNNRTTLAPMSTIGKEIEVIE